MTGPRYLLLRYLALCIDIALAGFLAVFLFVLVDRGVFRAPVEPVAPFALLFCVVMVAGSAALLARTGGRTPGKAMVGLRVAGIDGLSPALRREALRSIPVCLLLELMWRSAWLESLEGANIAFGAVLVLGMFAAFVWYYVMPFFALDGDYRARWDKIVGSRVERV